MTMIEDTVTAGFDARVTAEFDAAVTAEIAARRKVRRQRDEQVAALYPRARTFELLRADAVEPGEAAAAASKHVPATLTLVTPDHDDPGQDHLYAGALPVLSRDLHWDPAFEELSFTTADGDDVIEGNLRITHSRLHAYGSLNVGEECFAVEYEVKPQRYRMKVAKDAAYLSGPSALITWDPESPRWRDAAWSSGYEAGFTYGVNGEEVIGDEKVYTFVASFDDIKTGRTWQPGDYTYAGTINRQQIISYGLVSGVNPPTGEGTGYFPYTLRARLSAFAYDFDGGMVVGKPGYQGTVYGIKGDWTPGNVAGLYHLRGSRSEQLIGVHDGALYSGTTRVEQAVLDGDEMSWQDIPESLARSCGLPRSGRMTFSADGERVTGSSFGAAGYRVHPDDAAEVARRKDTAGLAAALRHDGPAASVAGHTLTDLIRMSQFATDADGRYYDIVQSQAMDDFYVILQNFMDQNLRKQFFSTAPPPPLGPLYGIAHTRGTKGTDPVEWYRSLSVAYTATSLGKFSPDPAAATLNTLRGETWIRSQSSASDVMQAQGPLMYQRRYQERHDNLEWFLVDQKANAAGYAPKIDATVTEWINNARASAVGTPEEIADLEKQIRELGEAAKKDKQYWAFALYAYTTSPAYLNMLQALLLTGVDVDGSEFSQRVQRTVALLNVLDTTSFFSQKYAYLLQLFELAQVLPQMADFGNKLEDFSLAVKQIIDQFIKTYIDSPDPDMRAAAQALQDNASSDLISRVLAILRTSAGVGYGLGNWGFLAETFQRTCARVLANVPAIVTRIIALAAAGAIMMFFLNGTADWNKLDEKQKFSIGLGASNIIAQVVIAIARRGATLAEAWSAHVGVRAKLAMFFKPNLLSQAQQAAASGLRGWLIQTNGPKIPAARLGLRAWWAARQGAAQGLLAQQRTLGQRVLRGIFGKNLSRFLATRVAAGMAIVGVVLSAIELSKGGEPLEQAANWMFLLASVLELVAAVGGWALAGSALAVGGMLVSSIFTIVAAVGFVALIVGAILLAVLLSRPQPSPVEQFAKSSGTFYMPYKAAIETFRFYQPAGQPQRAGVAMFTGGDRARALTVGSDGSIRQGPFTEDGHTAFYLTTDQAGRAQIGAPVDDAAGTPLLLALGTDENGTLLTKNAVGEDSPSDTKLMWYADIQGDGTYEEGKDGVRELRSAPFKLRSAYWADKGQTRYLTADGSTGWKLAGGDGTVIQLEMVVTKPQELTMNDVSWYTVAHDEETGPALQVPGSEPHLWSISPALPDSLEFLPESGTVRMRTGVDVPPVPKRSYTITVTNPVGSLQTTFGLEVVVPQDEVVLDEEPALV